MIDTKKVLIPLALVALIAVPALAQSTEKQGGNSQGQQQDRIQMPLLAPAGTEPGNQRMPVRNGNEVKTQNQGEDQQLKVKTEEQESSDTVKSGTGDNLRKANNEYHMSIVAQKVQEILANKNFQGGIGQQVKIIAQQQNQAQDQTRTELSKISNRSEIAKSLLGPDYKALKELKQLMQQNQVRIQQLQQLQTKLTDEGDISQVKQMIQVLTAQNKALQDQVNEAEIDSSVFGWLIKLFYK